MNIIGGTYRNGSPGQAIWRSHRVRPRSAMSPGPKSDRQPGRQAQTLRPAGMVTPGRLGASRFVARHERAVSVRVHWAVSPLSQQGLRAGRGISRRPAVWRSVRSEKGLSPILGCRAGRCVLRGSRAAPGGPGGGGGRHLPVPLQLWGQHGMPAFGRGVCPLRCPCEAPFCPQNALTWSLRSLLNAIPSGLTAGIRLIVKWLG